MTSQKSRNKQSNRQREIKPRGKRGLVSRNIYKGRLRLSVPAELSLSKKQDHPGLKMEATPDNIARADLIVSHVNAYIQSAKSRREEIDCQDLANYIEKVTQSVKADRPSQSIREEPPLSDLWKDYVEYQTGKVSSLTVESTYITVKNHISKLSTQDIKEAKKISDELEENTTSYSASYQVLIYLSACCKRAISNKKIKSNPFALILDDSEVPDTDSNPDPFSLIEEYRVIEAYRRHPRYHYYANYTEFCFQTGCRPGMGFGLKWKNVNFKESYIYFHITVTRCRGGDKESLGTKTRKREKKGYKFPMTNPRVREILEEEAARQGENRDPEDFVFQSSDGKGIRPHRYYYSWYGQKTTRLLKSGKKQYFHRGIVSELAELPEEEGGISHYRRPYTKRHTFITNALDLALQEDNLSPARFFQIIDEVARYVDNSRDTILDSYLGHLNDPSILNVSEARREEVLKAKKSYTEIQANLKETKEQLDELKMKLQETEKELKEQSAFSAFCFHQLALSQPQSSSYSPKSNIASETPESVVEQNQVINPSASELEQLLMSLMLMNWQDGEL